MKNCKIYNRIQHYCCEGCIINNKVFIVEKDGVILENKGNVIKGGFYED